MEKCNSALRRVIQIGGIVLLSCMVWGGRALASSHAAGRSRQSLRAKVLNSREPVVGIYQAPTSHWPRTIAKMLGSKLRADGFAVRQLTDRDLAKPSLLDASHLPVLILVNATTIRANAIRSLAHYARTGGFLVSLGGPAFAHMQFQVDGKWLADSECERIIRRKVQSTPLPAPAHAASWRELSYRPDKPYKVQVIRKPGALPTGIPVGYRFNFYLGWYCGFQTPQVAIPRGHTVAVFWAKGSKKTNQLTVEWDERDGSRWMKTVSLHSHWTRYVLPESAFYPYRDSPVRGRYFPGDHLHLDHAVTVSFGMANLATSEARGRHYCFEIAGIGTAAVPHVLGPVAPLLADWWRQLPKIDTIYPPYHVFTVRHMARVEVNPRQAIAPAVALPVPSSTMGVFPRAQATGMDKHMATRYVPLLSCIDKKGRFLAVDAALILPSTAASRHQLTTLSVPITDPHFFSSPATEQWLADIITRVQGGVYLEEGGAKEYACFGGTAMPIGAAVINRGQTARRVHVIEQVANLHGKTVFHHSFTIRVDSGQTKHVVTTWSAPVPQEWERIYHVTTTLENQHSLVLDRLVGSLRVLRVGQQHNFVTARGGLFYLKGRPWYVDGVNYCPESSMAQENWHLFLRYACVQSYDPQTVGRDFRDIKRIGFNVITLRYGRGDDPWNLLDMLARARELGLKVNLPLGEIDGLAGQDWGLGKFHFKIVKALISKLHLASNSTLFAYDIAWEPHWGNHTARQRLDAQWRRWVVGHYGSIAKAEAQWHFQAPRYRGKMTNPLDSQIQAGHNGPAALMVLAYNRFLDHLLQSTYGSARQLIHSIDPRHLVSFRMSLAGDPSVPGDVAYDFAGLGHAVDMFEPEGYGLLCTNPSVVNRAIFTIQYARAINPALPVVYAEFGASQWNPAIQNTSWNIDGAESSTAALRVAQIYRLFYRAILAGGGNGAICWFYPGGYLNRQNNDCGVINPDRSWRPVTYVIHKFAADLEKPRRLPTPAVWIPIHLNHVRAERGIYLATEKRFWKAYQSGKLPGLKVIPVGNN